VEDEDGPQSHYRPWTSSPGSRSHSSNRCCPPCHVCVKPSPSRTWRTMTGSRREVRGWLPKV
jgi:hypothetical protein